MIKQIKLRKFLSRVKSGGCSYNEGNKEEFHRLAMAALRELEGRLGFTRGSSRRWNPGGIAVSGDATLMGMWTENSGAYVVINNDVALPCGDFMFRSITHMRDYSGGQNCWARFDDLGTQGLIDKILKLKKIEGEQNV